MEWKVVLASDKCNNWDIEGEPVEINSLEDIENMPLRNEYHMLSSWDPPYKVEINFEKKEIIILDDWLE